MRSRPLVYGLISSVLAAFAITGCSAPDPSLTQPWPGPVEGHPVVSLSYDISPDLDSATGREHLRFTTDMRTCDVWFRLWPNATTSGKAQQAIKIRAVNIGDRVAPVRFVAPTALSSGIQAGLSERALDMQGNLTESSTQMAVTLPRCLDAGETVELDIDFTVSPPEGQDERLSYSRRKNVAWFASAFPMLSWQRGVGFTHDPPIGISGESITTETFALADLAITAPSSFQVQGAGRKGEVQDAGADRSTHHFSAPALRDIAFAVGDFETATVSTKGGTKVHAAVPAESSEANADAWARKTVSALEGISALLGPVPYPDIWVTVLPDMTSGLELPGALFMSDTSPKKDFWLLEHECAHMWFYGLVGNNQGRHPWLDESFATYVQMVLDDDNGKDISSDYKGHVGEPLEYWLKYKNPNSAYDAGVYAAGGRALVEARQAAGAPAFDKAIRAYLHAQAHRIAAPSDVRQALANLPEAIAVLEKAGAFVQEKHP